MMTRKASCSCGQLKVVASGEPIRISVCHCLACQRRTGNVFGAQARFRKENVAIEGQSTEWVRTGDSGTRLHFHFCPQCGATVYYWLANAPDVIAVAIGAFADPTFPAPRFSVYESRRHAWVEIPGEVEHSS